MWQKIKNQMGLGEFSEYERVLLPTTREKLEVLAADGPRVKTKKDGEAKWVIDATSQVGTNPLGHRDNEMVAAMKEFYESDIPLMMAGNDSYHPFQRQLAEKFTEIYPGDQRLGNIKTYYCNSGSEAVERGCLKTAQLYNGGNTYISFWNAFHGRTSLALSCNFSKAAHTEGYNSLFRVLPAPFATPDRDLERCIESLEQVLTREGADNVNAIIVEPVQGEGGYNVPHEQFLPRLSEIATENDIPLVCDEVQASLRTGEWFACENWDVEPDMISVAKAFSGGVTPFGAAMIKDEYATEEEGKHSSTFGGNPKECFAALQTIKIIEDNDYLLNATEQGAYLSKSWEDLEQHDTVEDVRGRGVMQAIEFTDATVRDNVLERLYEEHDIWTGACGNDQINPAIRFLLPVNVSRGVVEQIASGVIEAVSAVEKREKADF